MLAHQGILTGDIEIAVAGGMESMSNAPYLLAKAREGLRMGHAQMVDSMIHDGLWCPFENWHMGNAGETVADVYKVTRDEQDAFAADSHRKAAAAHAAGKFAAELLPVPIPQKKGEPLLFAHDESVRAETTAEVLRALKPAFKKDGSVTAGNAPPVNDGAAALVVMSARARRRARADAAGPHRRPGDQRARTEDAADDAGRSVAQGGEEGRVEPAGRRPLRAQRGLRGAGGGRHPRARHRCRAGSTSTAAPWPWATRSAHRAPAC